VAPPASALQQDVARAMDFAGVPHLDGCLTADGLFTVDIAVQVWAARLPCTCSSVCPSTRSAACPSVYLLSVYPFLCGARLTFFMHEPLCRTLRPVPQDALVAVLPVEREDTALNVATMLGRPTMRKRLLECHGWSVVPVPHDEWGAAAAVSEQECVSYMRRALSPFIRMQ
jgi:hypothetical protein